MAIVLIFNLALLITLVTAIGFSVELWARYSLKPSDIVFRWAYNTEQNAILGYCLKPNSSARESAVQGDRVLYDVCYTIGRTGWRIVPQRKRIPNQTDSEVFLAVFGGSFAYGHGLDDNGTVSAHLEKFLPEFEPYLFAAGGYGTANIFEIIRSGKLESIKEQHGLGLYILIDAHLDRVEGTLNTSRWAQTFPYYRLIDDGGGKKLRRYSSLAEVAPWRSWMFDIMRESQFLSRVKFDWPLGHSWERPETLDVTSALIEASSKAFQDRFPGSPFYVVFYPSKNSIPLSDALIPKLERAGVPYLTMHGLLDHLERDARTVDRTGHPTSLANQILAEEIARQLREQPCCGAP